MSKDTVKSLKKQNDELKLQIDSLVVQVKKLQEDVKQSEAKENSHGERSKTAPDKETAASLQYLGNEYDELQQLAREQVMTVRRDVTKINPTCIGLPAESTMHYAGIYDHLTPKQQKLLADTKKFKSEHDYKFCWIKNNNIFLRKTENSQPIMIKEQRNLDTLIS
ncbi:Hypothetical predicted protein [Paramuricea clavata]|uniref:FP protein C-terminal domain-containing protein n=1 Tax=Paramuricea clavata TaxID=317549 RepID=A0A6S7JCB7_PARCT|nr:Hypothetical predicted protein [Paramuricea clavata]